MADLSDEQLDGMALWGDPREVMLNKDHQPVGAMLVSAAVAEIRRRRAEQAAGREHVEQVVLETLAYYFGQMGDASGDAIARRVADRLSAPVLRAEEVGQLEAIRSSLELVTLDVSESVAMFALLDRLIAGAKP